MWSHRKRIIIIVTQPERVKKRGTQLSANLSKEKEKLESLYIHFTRFYINDLFTNTFLNLFLLSPHFIG